MASKTSEVCPVVGTTNSTLPPSHPSVDLTKPGQVCPVVGAKTEHHGNLSQHPDVPIPSGASPTDAQRCPVASKMVNEPQAQELDDKVCPIVGPVTTVLPPDHPATEGQDPESKCPVTNAKVGHHKGKVTGHPSVAGAADGAVCPVVGHA